MAVMPGKSYLGPLPPLSDEEVFIQDNLKRHVSMLARKIGERNVWRSSALYAAASYIQNALKELGYATRVQPFRSRDLTLDNIIAELPGTTRPEKILVVGAHYDTVAGSPGANDNGSGVAALLEIARLLAHSTPPRTLRFVAFANEEAPFFYTDEMGSRIYAARARQQHEQIIGMISLETIGYYTDNPGSQRYPFPFRYFYPDTGNFIGFVGNLSSWRLVRRSISAFRKSTLFPSEGLAAPGWMMGVHWSDHWSFWQAGYPAIMITDTALFRYKPYHSSEDTPDKLEYASYARVVNGLRHVVAELAGITTRP